MIPYVIRYFKKSKFGQMWSILACRAANSVEAGTFKHWDDTMCPLPLPVPFLPGSECPLFSLAFSFMRLSASTRVTPFAFCSFPTALPFFRRRAPPFTSYFFHPPPPPPRACSPVLFRQRRTTLDVSNI